MEQDKNLYPKNFPEPPDPLRTEKLDKIISTELMKWKVVNSPLPLNPMKERNELYRRLDFEDFNHVIDFINKLAPICNAIPHNPRWENVWRTLHIYLSTWDANHAITYKDILLARNIEILYVNEFHNKYEYPEQPVIESKLNKKEVLQFIELLKKSIAKDEVGEVFNEIEKYYLQNRNIRKPDEFILLQSRYAKATKNLIVGNVPNDDISIEMNQIKFALLGFLNLDNFQQF